MVSRQRFQDSGKVRSHVIRLNFGGTEMVGHQDLVARIVERAERDEQFRSDLIVIRLRQSSANLGLRFRPD